MMGNVLKRAWALTLVVLVTVVCAAVGVEAAVPPSAQTTVTVNIGPYAEVSIANTASIQYSGNPAESSQALPDALLQILGPKLGNVYRFTQIPFTVARNAKTTLTLSFTEPFKSQTGASLITAAAMVSGDSIAHVYWQPEDQVMSAALDQATPAAVVDNYELYVAAGFGDQISSQAAGSYATTFTLTVAASLS